MRRCLAAFLPLLLASTALAAEPKLGFEPAEEAGYYQFNTGVLRGQIRLTGKMQGVTQIVHIPSGREVAQGGKNLPGFFSPYRIYTTGTRHGGSVRDWATVAKVLPDGALEVSFAAGEGDLEQLTAVYRWVRPDTLDVETRVTPRQAMPQFELFTSNYFPEGFQVSVYLKPGLKSPGEARFVPVEWGPLIDGTYAMFPRDREACLTIFDGRWDEAHSPVQWTVPRHLAAPLAMRRDAKSGIAAVLMSPPEDCFAVGVSYDKTPVDNIANHRSIYQSLFGRDLAAGETARAHQRLVVGPLSDAQAVEQYQQYLQERKP